MPQQTGTISEAENTSDLANILAHPSAKSAKKSSASQAKAPSSKSQRKSKGKTTSRSHKSDSGSLSLNRLLRRKPDYRVMESGDRKYAWAAYKLGAFGPDRSADSHHFNKQLDDYLILHDIAYIISAPTDKGKIPVGLVVGKYMGPILYLGDTTWFPWSSDRNKLESIANLLNELRRQYIVMFFCNMRDKEFYVNIAKRGVIRRVGTIYDLLIDGPSPLFQTRKP